MQNVTKTPIQLPKKKENSPDFVIEKHEPFKIFDKFYPAIFAMFPAPAFADQFDTLVNQVYYYRAENLIIWFGQLISILYTIQIASYGFHKFKQI